MVQKFAWIAARAERFILQVKRGVFEARRALSSLRASAWASGGSGNGPRRSRMAASGAARTWGRARKARNKYTVLNAMGTIWCGFGRAEPRNNGVLVTETLSGVTYLYLKERSAGVKNPTGTSPPAANLAWNSYYHRLGGPLPVSRPETNPMT